MDKPNFFFLFVESNFYFNYNEKCFESYRMG